MARNNMSEIEKINHRIKIVRSKIRQIFYNNIQKGFGGLIAIPLLHDLVKMIIESSSLTKNSEEYLKKAFSPYPARNRIYLTKEQDKFFIKSQKKLYKFIKYLEDNLKFKY